MRHSLGHTQAEMAFAIGIQPARYSKYETGRSEAPYGVLTRIAGLFEVDLHHLITGDNYRDRQDRGLKNRLVEFVETLPWPAVVYDLKGHLVAHNQLYIETFFEQCPGIVRPGTHQEFILRAWANSCGLEPQEVDRFVKARLAFNSNVSQHGPISVGSRNIHIAESRYADYRLVLVLDLAEA